MANPKPAYFRSTDDLVIDGITNGFYWQLDATRTVNYSISNGFHGERWNSPTLVSYYFESAISTFASYANIQFTYSGYYANPSVANQSGSEINLSIDSVYIPEESIWAIGFYPDRSYNNAWYEGAPGDIFISVNSAANNLPSYEPGSQGWFLLLHELGHTLGLKHPHDDGGTGRPTFSQLGIGWLDFDWASVMSYEDSFGYDWIRYDPATPMILDVIGLQYLYGKNPYTNADNTNHSLNEANFYYTLWDASGLDTVDVSAAQTGWTIYLPQQAWSSLVDTKVGFATPTQDFQLVSPKTFIWLAGDYENAIGSNFADLIRGNAFSNDIAGGAENDTLYGFDGDDLFDWDPAFRLGNDLMYGGLGNDVYVLDNLRDQVIELPNEGDDTIWVDFTYSIAAIENIENIYLFGSENINATGNFLKNKFLGNSGNNRIDGAGGLDVAVYEGVAAEYQITIASNVTTIQDTKTQRDGTDTLTNVERLKFSDTNVALDIGRYENAGQAYRLYKAAFNRLPDEEGLGFWIYSFDNGSKLNDVAQGFINSDEFPQLYGFNSDNNTFLSRLYNNVLGREFDQEGYNFWLAALNNGLPRNSILAQFSESPENISNVIDLIGQGIRYEEWTI